MSTIPSSSNPSAISNSKQVVAFVPFCTFIDPTFWSQVNKLKVNKWQLDEASKKIFATYSTSGRRQITKCSLCLSHDSFGDQSAQSLVLPKGESLMTGELLLVNTRKAFLQEMDRKALLESCAQKLWTLITSDSKEWLSSPSLLNTFCLTAWADIKQFTYYYWNCLPVLLYPSQIEQNKSSIILTEDLFQLAVHYLNKTQRNDPFLIANSSVCYPLAAIDPNSESLLTGDVMLVFSNPSSIVNQPGWPLRNLLSAIAYLRKDWTSLKVLALRSLSLKESYILEISWSRSEAQLQVPKAIGWERDLTTESLTHKTIELKSMFDPLKIMEESVDLNLKLIRWRQAPTIELDKFTQLKALVIGSGTLGCNLARCLLGWGVRQFTFVDHATVSYNNPIRQSLFTFEDCCQQSGNFNKAKAAACSLKKIYPLVEATGVDMKIPMPGHPYSEKEKADVQKTCEDLDQLIQANDVIFLVMDSRESRWLPTLMAAVHNKLAITVALGFDSYVVIRHGAHPLNYTQTTQLIPDTSEPAKIDLSSIVPGSELGCYFCSDVTAPGNSVLDRTLDQQCTISRSGISMIASGMAIELLSSVLQHELGQSAPARLAEVDENSSLLGGTPHQLRAFLSRFHTMTPTVRRFDKCTACGLEVIKLYKEQSFEFLHMVFHDPAALERVTGLLELQQSANKLQLDILELEDDESVGE